jgi:outer membrane protein, heavy metal efflux system
MNYANTENWRCMMLNIKTGVLLLSLLPLLTLGQQPSDTLIRETNRNVVVPVLTLQSILKEIDQNNLLLQSFGLKAQAYKYSAEAATAWMAPMVGAGTFMTPYPFQEVMEARDKGSVMLRLEQDIPNRSKLAFKRRYVESQGAVEQASRAVTLNDYKAQARRLYYNWLVAEQRMKVLQQNERIMTTMKKIEEVRYPYNQSQLGNIYKIESRIEENRNMMRMQEGEIGRARGWLNSLMNHRGNDSFTIDTNLTPRFDPSVHDTALLAGSRGDVLRMNESIRSMQLNIESMQQERKPDFKVQFDHMTPIAGMMPKAFSVMGMVSIPIAPWASKMYKSEVKAMQYNIQAMERERAAMLQETQGMLYGMQSEIQSMQKRIQGLEKTVIPAMQKSLDASFINYQENKLQVPVVIDAWEALNMLQMNLLDEKLKLYQMIVDYEKELYR